MTILIAWWPIMMSRDDPAAERNAEKHFHSRIRQNSGIVGDTAEVWRLRRPADRNKNVISNALRRIAERA